MVEQRLDAFDNTQANTEGWGIFSMHPPFHADEPFQLEAVMNPEIGPEVFDDDNSAWAYVRARAAENERLREGLRAVELKADNAAWNMGKPSHQFTPAKIQNGFFEIRDHARTVLEAQEGGE